jgi:hypothetical protein
MSEHLFSDYSYKREYVNLIINITPRKS